MEAPGPPPPPLVAFLGSTRSTDLKLGGPPVAKWVADNGGKLPAEWMAAPEVTPRLTTLEITGVPLAAAPSQLGLLVGLRSLTLEGLALPALPAELGNLASLTLLALSRNRLSALPPDLVQLTQLQTLLLSHNALPEVPFVVPHLTSLVVLDLTANAISSVPETLCALPKLARLMLAHNQISEVPSNISELSALRTLDVSSNRLTALPSELALCSKLKELDASRNPIADKKLAKLTEGGNNKTSDVLKILRGGSKTKAKAVKAEAEQEALEAGRQQVTVLRRGTLEVVASSGTRTVRPHLLCCVVHGLAFDADTYRRFITLQTDVHEGVAKDRTLAVLGTHDIARIRGPLLRYQCSRASGVRFQPLKYDQVMTGTELLQAFETDPHMKRHLHLITEPDPELAYLVDMRGEVLSLLPLVNSEYSKCGPETTDCLVECSSATSLADARNAMNELLVGMLREDLITSSMTLETVRVVDESGTLRAVYPAKTDLPDYALVFQ